MATFANLDSAEDRLEAAGLPPTQIAALTAEVRDALVFTRRMLPDAQVPIGTSKLGGAPDLPESMAWPERPAYTHADEMVERLAQTYGPSGYVPRPELMTFFEDHLSTPQPLAFLAQLDLETLARTSPFELGFAPQGRLLVFVDPAPFSTGANAWDEGWIKVIHDRSDQPLRRATIPDRIAETMRTRSLAELGFDTGEPFDMLQCERLTPHAAITLPMPLNHQPRPVFEALREAHGADFGHLYHGLGPDDEVKFSDQLGGHPHPIQNHVERDLFEVAQPLLRPVTLGEQSGRWDPDRWQHIFCVGGESYLPAFPSSWGDGDLYIAHRPDPAAPDALGQVWALSQQT